MKIQSITLEGFRCFGDIPATIRLSDEITALIGANGSGKTAFLDALSRVFGVTQEQRTVRYTDFYIPPNGSYGDYDELDLYIDIRLEFPELEQDKPSAHAVAPCFQHMIVNQPGSRPFCRVRLEASWSDDGTPDGDIEQKLWWVTTDEETPTNEYKQPLEPHDRRLIQVLYIPATRDVSKQLATATSTMAGRLLRAIRWSETTREEVEKATQEIRNLIGSEPAIKSINEALLNRWSDLHDDTVDAEPELHAFNRRFEQIIRRFNIAFRPTESGDEREYDALSDGQKSLFFFSLATAVFDVERRLLDSGIGTEESTSASSSNDQEMQDEEVEVAASSKTGFITERLQIPSLTFFALEEPENHLAPFFLPRIIKQIRSITTSQMAQAVFTSHSPATLNRIDPTEVRHFRLNPQSRISVIREVTLPETPVEAAKYVREAVIAYPELYFAKFVVLAEGPSEQIVLPRLASAQGQDLDRSFVPIIPLGGRHVNHFWKLLSDLDIPYATLLDLDLGREGGAWGRIKYVCEQLLAVGVNRDDLLTIVDKDDNEHVLSDEELQQLHTWDTQDIKGIKEWLRDLEDFGVFFSTPLDLDMAMLKQFTTNYQSTVESGYGPRVPAETDPKYQQYLRNAAEGALGESSPEVSFYEKKLSGWYQLFPWYRYLFLNKSKPATHILALSNIEDQSLVSEAPPALKRLLNYVSEHLNPSKEAEHELPDPS